ncbi:MULTISPECIES: hypothetical protein [Paenibacillus]|uniref:Uncharacterized protein n=1 Tax=Paenibacillus xylanilyticus TaxID=248903 RepID=A0A7Y6C1E0_9BACL|nr:hypothetical protein [Paenibacillus xylanilyticus]NUU78827.1 hypothetical protein [Paenibacillus xylanilyticus]
MRLQRNISIIINVSLTLCLIILTVFSIHQYKLQTLYKDYLSQNLSHDIISLAQAIQTNNKIYEQILQTNPTSNSYHNGLNVLYNNYRSIGPIADTYSLMYNQFQGFKESNSLNIKNFSSSALEQMNYLQELVNSDAPIDSKTKVALEKYYSLNSEWLKIIEQSELLIVKENGEISFRNGNNLTINELNWANLFKDLEAQTSVFLKKYDTGNI